MSDERLSKYTNEIKALHSLYKEVFGTDNGKKLLQDMEKKYHIHDTMVTANGVDALKLAYSEGQRSVILSIKKMIDWDKASEEISKLRSQNAS